MNAALKQQLFFAGAFLGVYALLTTPVLAAGPFGVGMPDAPNGGFSGPFGSIFLWFAQKHAAFKDMLQDVLEQFRASPHAAWLLIGTSFAYGVFHAVGPGHGKAVITSYLLVSRQTLKRGVLLAFAAAFMQGLMAIAVVSAGVLILKKISAIPAVAMTNLQNGLMIGGYGLVVLVGAWLLWRKLTEREEDEVSTRADAKHEQNNLGATPLVSKQVLTTILAVGIRPCTGSLFLLTFAFSQNLHIVGVVSVFLVSLGTAITVSSFVALAVSAKGVALRYADTNARVVGRVVHFAEIGLALFILLLGLIFFSGAMIDEFYVGK
jgi:ABC-type nickel/cobalt efflux system permease component RcnA